MKITKKQIIEILQDHAFEKKKTKAIALLEIRKKKKVRVRHWSGESYYLSDK